VFDPFHCFVINVRQRTTRRARFQKAPERIDLSQISDSQLRDQVAPSRQIRDLSFLFKYAERFSNRREAYAGLFGNCFLVHSLSRFKRARDD
jgi:hypothetical protein